MMSTVLKTPVRYIIEHECENINSVAVYVFTFMFNYVYSDVSK